MVESSESFRRLRFHQVATSTARQLILHETPAVYAWYRDLSLGDYTGAAEAFLARLDGLLSAKLSCQHRGTLGYLYELSIQECGGGIGPESRRLLEAIAQNPESRSRLADILDLSTFLQAPLYVGKTTNLRQRTTDHVSGVTDLYVLLEKAGIDFHGCILRYRYINPEDLRLIQPTNGEARSDSAIAGLIEDLLTRLSPAAFVRRPGG